MQSRCMIRFKFFTDIEKTSAQTETKNLHCSIELVGVLYTFILIKCLYTKKTCLYTLLEIHACSNPSPLFPNIVST